MEFAFRKWKTALTDFSADDSYDVNPPRK